MALGLCCEWVTKNPKGFKNILVSRRLQLGKFNKGNYSEAQIKQCYIDNLTNLLAVLPIIYASGIRFFRMSSSIFPLFDKVPKNCYDNKTVKELLQKAGKYFIDNQMRVTTHPGQFVVLSSDDPNIVNNSIREMNFHGWVFDSMGFPRTPYYAINIHGGKSDRNDALIQSINRLDASARNRMTLENDEFSYTVQCLETISQSTGVPIVYDSHHHQLNNGGISGEIALEKAIKTWPIGIKPTTHLSNSKPEFRNSASITKQRTHSDYIDYFPDHQLQAYKDNKIDIEVEAKAKNLAILTLPSVYNIEIG